MITLCNVVAESSTKHLPYFLESVETTLKIVDEVLLCKVDDPPDTPEQTWIKNGVTYRVFPYHNDFFVKWPTEQERRSNSLFLGHPLGLKYAIDRAKNDIILTSDNDLFFYMPVDEFYYKMMAKHDLSFIGVTSACALLMSYQWFPCVISMLLRRQDLPGPDFMKGRFSPRLAYGQPMWPEELMLDGEYLMAGKFDPEEFPNPDGAFDVGCHLWQWAKQKNLNWMSFQSEDVHVYWNKFYKCSNPKIREKFPISKLIWHCTAGGWCTERYWDDYHKALEEFKKSRSEVD